MKKLVALLMALALGLFSTVSTADITPIDTPAETKVYEWVIGYARRCRKIRLQPKNWTPVKRFARRVAFAPLMLFLGTALAETNANERYWSCMARQGTPEEATAAFNAIDSLSVPKPKQKRASHPRWAKIEPERVEFLSAECLDDVTSAKRGWFTAAGLDGFDGETVLAYKWYKPEAQPPVEEPPEDIKFRGEKYHRWCASQSGVKDGTAIYLKRKFLYTETNGKMNHVILDAPGGLPVSKQNQVRALHFTACVPTEAKNSQLIILDAKRRIDKATDVVDGRPVVHVDVPNGYAVSEATEIEQALADGGCIYGMKAGINMPAAQFRNMGDMKCAGLRYRSKHIGETVINCFGREVVITDTSIISTTDNHKSIKAFLKKVETGEMTGEQAEAAWLEKQGGPDGLIYACPVHPQNGRVTLGRQIFGKFSQLSDEALFKVAGKDIGKLAEMGFEGRYKKALMRKYAALRIPSLAPILDHPLLYMDMVRSYLSKWHKVASGGVEVDGSLSLAVIDPAWFDDVYLGGKDVADPTAGIVKAGTILFGTPNKEGVNPYIGQKVALGRFPQVKSGLPVVIVAGGSYASGVIVISGRVGDMVLQDLDADLDGDKIYVIVVKDIVTAIELANKIFNFPHVIFSKWEAESTNETLAQYLARNAKWQSEESVGSFATHQFVIDEMVPLLKEDEDWRKLLRPTLSNENEYADFITLEKVFDINILLGVGGNMATDSGKLNHKPDAPEYITKILAFRPMSQRDAHPNTPDSGFKKRHEAFMPDKYPGVGTNVLKRLHDMMMKYIPIEEIGKSDFNDFEYDENGRIIPDRPLTLYCPVGFEPVPENVWKHVFGNDLDQIKTSLVCYPDDAETVELNRDLQVFGEAKEGISLVTYFAKYAAKIVAVESSLDDDKKGWTVAGRDTFGDNLIQFVRIATGRKDISAEDCLWLAYNALCQSFIGTQSQSRGTAFAVSQFLKLFEKMIIAQVCQNTGEKPPKIFEQKASIKDSVTKEPVKELEIEITDEEPPFDTNVDVTALKQQLLTKGLETTDEEPPAEAVDTSALKQQLMAASGAKPLSWVVAADPDDEYEEEEEE